MDNDSLFVVYNITFPQKNPSIFWYSNYLSTQFDKYAYNFLAKLSLST